MRLGLGSGSTTACFLVALGERIAAGELERVVGVPTSVGTERAARDLGIPLGGLEDLGALDLTVDGADEVDPDLNLIKGLGGALLREKMVAQASAHFLVVIDHTKLVRRLGGHAPVPVEVVPFGFRSHLSWLTSLGAYPVVRRRPDPGGEPYVTDNGNHVIDCRFPEGIPDPGRLDSLLAARAGVVESGLFLGMAREVVLAGPDGVQHLTGSAQRLVP